MIRGFLRLSVANTWVIVRLFCGDNSEISSYSFNSQVGDSTIMGLKKVRRTESINEIRNTKRHVDGATTMPATCVSITPRTNAS